VAALSAADRAALDRRAQRQLTRDAGGAFGALPAADLRAAIDAIDDWCEANQASFNTAIPQPARSLLTATQKAWLLMYVIAQRATRS
jgi:hypothetical protein